MRFTAQLITIFRLWFIGLFLHVLVSTELVNRQTTVGDEILNYLINIGKAGADATGGFLEDEAENLGNAFDSFFNPKQGSPASVAHPSPIGQSANGASTDEQPSNPSDSKIPSTNTACNPQQPGPCKLATPHIIWPQRCDSQNEAVSTYLAEHVMDKPIYISQDRGCGGVDFWATELTGEQVRDIRNMNDVLAVEPDRPVSLHSLHRLEKRDMLESRHDPYGHLGFISTPPHTSMNSRYFCFSKAGENVEVYLIDTGVESLHSEFQHHHVLKRILYASKAAHTPTDEFGHGTCLGSLIGGEYLGVANRISMVVVKIHPEESSILHALQLVIDDLLDRVNSGQKVAGYTVVATSFGWVDQGFYRDRKLKERIKRLLNEFQAVVVTVAGDTSVGSVQDGLHLIPAVYSTEQDFPLIVVGALDTTSGKKFEWSLVGDHVTLVAPGETSCALNEPGDSTVKLRGTSLAAAMISGFAGYLLSLEDLGPKLRSAKAKSVPHAVRDWMVDKAYIRDGGTDEDMAVWNGLKVMRGSKSNFRWYPDLGVNP